MNGSGSSEGVTRALNAPKARGIFSSVRVANKVIGLFLALLWLPATSLCIVERTGWLGHDDCCPSSSSESSSKEVPEKTPCCELAAAAYKPTSYNDPGESIIPALLPDFTPLQLTGLTPPNALFKPPDPAFDLAASPFSLRTAIPSRAPPLRL